MVKIIADKLKITGPQVDGGYKIILSVGEYQQEQVSKLIQIPQQQAISVEVKEA